MNDLAIYCFELGAHQALKINILCFKIIKLPFKGVFGETNYLRIAIEYFFYELVFFYFFNHFVSLLAEPIIIEFVLVFSL